MEYFNDVLTTRAATNDYFILINLSTNLSINLDYFTQEYFIKPQIF